MSPDPFSLPFSLPKLRQLKGYLGLQNHSTEVKFRNLRLGPPIK